MPSVKLRNLVSNTILLLLLTLSVSVQAQTQAAAAAASSTTEASKPTETVICERYLHTGFWDIDIDNFPNLPPECGPPFSINADRDPNHLPIQLVIIFASYLGLTAFVGTSILTIRFRRKSRILPKAIELKLVEKDTFDPTSPKSPNSIISWMRNPLKKKGQAGGEDPRSPGIDSIASFDFKVIENDRARREVELDRLYAAVMAHDESRKSQLSQFTELNYERNANAPPLPRGSSNASTLRASNALTESGLPTRVSVASTVNSKPADRRLARVVHSEIPRSPVNQGPSRLYNPPDQFEHSGHGFTPISPGLVYPMSPTGQAQLPDDMYPASPPPGERRMRLPNQPYSPTVGTMGRGMLSPITPISMMNQATMLPNPNMTSRAPLPHDMYPASPTRQEYSQNFPTTPTLPPPVNQGFPELPASASHNSKHRKVPSITVNTNLRPDDYDDRAPLSASFQNTPQDESEAGSPEQYFQRPATSNSGTGRGRRPPTLNLSINNRSTTSLSSMSGLPSGPAQAKTSATASINKPLPLRVAFDSDVPLRSPGVKTTILQPRADHFARGPRTARTPRTGQIPPTPYSAYMPFTPVTPVTPHLVTRLERKQKRKQEGRTLLDESDLVKEDSDEDEDWDEK